MADAYYGLSDNAYGIKELVEAEQNILSPADIEVAAEWNNGDKSAVKINTKTTFLIDEDASHYSIGFALVEDGMKGNGDDWIQNNYYSGRSISDPNLQSLSALPSQLSDMEYNHVAVDAWGISQGISGSVKDIQAGVPQGFSYVCNISQNELIQDKSRLTVVALLFDKNSGKICNAAKTTIGEYRPKGDLDAKGYTDVSDVVAAINHVLGEKLLTYDEKELLDMNEDGELNVGDIILLVKAILDQGNQFEAPKMARGEAEAVDLTRYTAMQLNVNVPTGSSIRDIRLAGSNGSSHKLAYQQTGNGQYTVVVYSMGNQTFKPVNGCLLEVITDGDGEPVTADVLLATPTGERTFIGTLPNGIVTGISSVYSGQMATANVYDLRGNKVLDKGMSTLRLPKGIYIMNGKRIIK